MPREDKNLLGQKVIVLRPARRLWTTEPHRAGARVGRARRGGRPWNEHGSLLRECDIPIVNRRSDLPSGKQFYDLVQDLIGQDVHRAFASQPGMHAHRDGKVPTPRWDKQILLAVPDPGTVGKEGDVCFRMVGCD